jgi:antitoxin PrlF
MAIVVASRLTRKYQATIPAEVRRALRLKQGDTVQFEVAGARVMLKRQTAADRAYLKGLQKTLGEWDSAFDDEAYGDL